MEKEFKGKIILITGGTGSIGSELVKQILKYSPEQLRIFSRDESKQYELMEELNYPKNVSLLIGDIRDKARLSFALKDVDIVLHAAAMKHVAIGEYNPFEVIKTNIVGSQNVIDAAIDQKVKKVVGISTDKAVNPTSVLGTSKLMMEKLFVNANNYTKKEETIFSCVRFGNVLWSRGSVLPSWSEHANKDKTIKVTNQKMTRFFMSKEEAIDLVLQSVVLTQGGEIFTFKMPAIKLMDLAKAFIGKYYPDQDIKIDIIGPRQGEKMHEELFDHSDLTKTIYTDDKMFIIVPSYRLAGLVGEEKQNLEYSGFEVLKDVQNLSSADSSDLDSINKLI